MSKTNKYLFILLAAILICVFAFMGCNSSANKADNRPNYSEGGTSNSSEASYNLGGLAGR